MEAVECSKDYPTFEREPEEGVGIVETKYVTFDKPGEELKLESGEVLFPLTIAYETYGTLNKEKTNTIFIFHALSGDAHVAGKHSEDDPKVGWWDSMVGRGRPFDTDKFFVVCANVIGGCKGSTGPSSINPATGEPYGLDFPIITIKDMVNAHARLLDYLGIEKVFCVVGGSMGGMQVLQWAVDYPDRAVCAIPIATTARLSAQGIAFNEVGRQAIMSDPKWNGGKYKNGNGPDTGLAIARMIGHITYLSEKSLQEKFGRRLQVEKRGYSFQTEFQIESYLHHKGQAFTRRFDANSYLYITKAMDYFDIAEKTGGDLVKAFAPVKSRFLVVSFTSDWLYPSEESRAIVKALKTVGADVAYCDMDAPYGHDSFLLDVPAFKELIRGYLQGVWRETYEE